ncbi:MAG: NAD-binding protein [Treponema sp.]|jgi:trk system potassium uptake protein TrkA|nr:NAD-binding protein [Treponema sp.]
MRIVIVGAGMVGTQLARHLIQEKHDVSLIESNEERARYASNHLDCLVLRDEGNSLATLEDAGIAKADALVCTTDSDEVNMIICGLAASQYPAVLKIARVRNDDYVRLNPSGKRSGSWEGQKILGVDYFVHPDIEAARSVLNAIEHGAMGDVLVFANTSYELGSIEIAGSSTFDGLVLKDYHSLVKNESIVTLIDRKGTSILPGGATTLTRGDRVHILAKEKELDTIFKFAGCSERPLRKIGIVGGGRVGTLIAEGLFDRAKDKPGTREPKQEPKKLRVILDFFKRLLPKSVRRVIIIEQDYSMCKELAARFPEALVLNEDISDEGFVAEERINNLDLIVTATDHQELNIITAIYLKSKGVHRAIALVTGAGYAVIARQLGVDVVIPMKSVVVDSILSHLMGGGVKGLHRIGDGSIDIIEIEIRPATAAVNKPITAFRLSTRGLVMLVNRGETSFIPKGDYVFHAGDHIILIAKHGSETEIEKFFGVSL